MWGVRKDSNLADIGLVNEKHCTVAVDRNKEGISTKQ